MDRPNWKNHPFIITIIGALLIGYMVRKITEPEPYKYSYEPKPSPKAQSVPKADPVVASPSAGSAPAQHKVPEVASSRTPSAPIALTAPVESPYVSPPVYGPGRRVYTTYTFTIGETSYPLDGQAAFDHLGEMKNQCESLDAQANSLESAIDAARREVDELSQRIALARQSLDRTSQFAVDNFNAMVSSEGRKIEEMNAQIDEYNRVVERRKAIFLSMHVYARQHPR
jgi:hypothetical protein